MKQRTDQRRKNLSVSLPGALIWAFMSVPGMLYGWSDNNPLTTSNRVRVVHITELRAAIDDKRYNYGFSSGTWTDPTLTAGSSLIRKVHLDDMRDKLDDITDTFHSLCPSTVPVTPSWNGITAGSTLIRAFHFNQLRDTVGAIGAAGGCCPVCKYPDGASGCSNSSGPQTGCNTCNGNYTRTCSGGSCVDNTNCNVCNGTRYTQYCNLNACANVIDCQGGAGGATCGSCVSNACSYPGNGTK